MRNRVPHIVLLISLLAVLFYIPGLEVNASGLAAKSSGLQPAWMQNTPPTVENIPPKTVYIGELVKFKVNAWDPDTQDKLSFFLDCDSKPCTWASIDMNTGEVTLDLRPSSGTVVPNSYVYAVFVFDGKEFTPAGLSIKVLPNAYPQISPIEPQQAFVNELLKLNVTASDPNAGQTLRYSLEGLVPAGAAIDSAGLFTWTPGVADKGKQYRFQVVVKDPHELTAATPLTISVGSNIRPVFTDFPPDTSLYYGIPWSFQLKANDADGGTLSFQQLTCAAQPQFNVTPGLIEWNAPPLPGNTLISPTTYNYCHYVVCDNSDAANACSFERKVQLKRNYTSTAITNPAQAQQSVLDYHTLNYQYQASVPAGYPQLHLEYALFNAPVSGASISTSGLFTWVPNGNFRTDPYLFPVRISLKDSSGKTYVTVDGSISAKVNAPPPGYNPPVITLETDYLVVDLCQPSSVVIANNVSFSDLDPNQTWTPKVTGTWFALDSYDPVAKTFKAIYTGERKCGGFLLTSPVWVEVCDNTLPNKICTSKSFRWTVAAPNQPPKFAEIPEATFNALHENTLAIPVTDSETFTLSLISDSTPGATIRGDSAQGYSFVWTPDEAMEGKTVLVKLRADDNNVVNNLSEIEFTVKVKLLNHRPNFRGTDLLTLNLVYGERKELNLSAYDPDPGQTLSYTYTWPAGYGSIDSNMNFVWDEPASYNAGSEAWPVFISVCDNSGEPNNCSLTPLKVNLSKTQSINTPPALEALPDELVLPGQSLRVRAYATDLQTDQTISYSLNSPGLPSGVQGPNQTGLFTIQIPDGFTSGSVLLYTVHASDGTLTGMATRTLKLRIAYGAFLPLLMQ